MPLIISNIVANIAYGIDFSGGSVEFYYSTGPAALALVVPAVSVSASSVRTSTPGLNTTRLIVLKNGEDWHLGVLTLPRSGYSDNGAEV